MRLIALSAAAAAFLAFHVTALAQEEDAGSTADAVVTETPAEAAGAETPAAACPGGRCGQQRRHHQGHHQGRHRGHHQSGPTLRIVTERPGFAIEFECNAAIDRCLEAIERVYDISASRGGRRSGTGE